MAEFGRIKLRGSRTFFKSDKLIAPRLLTLTFAMLKELYFVLSLVKFNLAMTNDCSILKREHAVTRLGKGPVVFVLHL
jgi:hypothetical protein